MCDKKFAHKTSLMSHIRQEHHLFDDIDELKQGLTGKYSSSPSPSEFEFCSPFFVGDERPLQAVRDRGGRDDGLGNLCAAEVLLILFGLFVLTFPGPLSLVESLQNQCSKSE
jgi:hypothetical protein